MRVLPMVVAVIGCSSASTAQRSPNLVSSAPPEIGTVDTTIDMYPPRQVVFEGGVRGIPAVVYSSPSGYRPLTLDLYVPPSAMPHSPAGFPLVIAIHGGDWLEGDPRRNGAFVDFPAVLAQLASRGYVVASIEYRLSGEAKFPAQVYDVKNAIRWLRDNATTYEIDPNRVVTWGEYSGAYLATLAAVTCNAGALEPVGDTDTSACVQGTVAWSGVFDLTTLADEARLTSARSRDSSDAPEWRLLGCPLIGCLPPQIAAASPVSYLDAKDPPMLLIAGAEDTIVPHTQTLRMAGRLTEAGVPHSVEILRGVAHSFIGPTPDDTRVANLKALEETFRFIDQTIGQAAQPASTSPPTGGEIKARFPGK